MANATVNLQGLQQAEAQGVNLAQDQVQKATDQENHYQDLINKGLSDAENGGLIFQWGKAIAEGVGVVAAAYVGQHGPLNNWPNPPYRILWGPSTPRTAMTVGRKIGNFSATRPADDVVIANEQITIAKGQEAIASQQLAISQIQSGEEQCAGHADVSRDQVHEYVALYRWMSGVLGVSTPISCSRPRRWRGWRRASWRLKGRNPRYRSSNKATGNRW